MTTDILAPILLVLFFSILFILLSFFKHNMRRKQDPDYSPERANYLREGVALGMLIGTVLGAFIMRDHLQLGVLAGLILGAISGLLIGTSIKRRH